MMRISSEAFVRALAASGFRVYRQTPELTILERGLRAVTIPTSAALKCEVLMDLRRMAGMTWHELQSALLSAASLERLAVTPEREPPEAAASCAGEGTMPGAE